MCIMRYFIAIPQAACHAFKIALSGLLHRYPLTSLEIFVPQTGQVPCVALLPFLRVIDQEMESLVVPEASVAEEAGHLLEQLRPCGGERTWRNGADFCCQCWRRSMWTRKKRSG